MRLDSFRVQNYKRIEDTGWLRAGDLTVLVGKNEAGKSAILRGLSKIKPSDGELYDGLREFPRRRFSDQFDESARVGSAYFLLDEADREGLGDVSLLLPAAMAVRVTRTYANRYLVDFEPMPGAAALDARTVREAGQRVRDELREAFAPDGYGEQFGPLKESLLGELDGLIAALPATGPVTVEQVDGLLTAITSRITEQWQGIALGVRAAMLSGCCEMRPGGAPPWGAPGSAGGQGAAVRAGDRRVRCGHRARLTERCGAGERGRSSESDESRRTPWVSSRTCRRSGWSDWAARCGRRTCRMSRSRSSTGCTVPSPCTRGRNRRSSRAMPARSTTWSAPPSVDWSGRSLEPSRPGGSIPRVWWGKPAARSSWRARSWS